MVKLDIKSSDLANINQTTCIFARDESRQIVKFDKYFEIKSCSREKIECMFYKLFHLIKKINV